MELLFTKSTSLISVIFPSTLYNPKHWSHDGLYTGHCFFLVSVNFKTWKPLTRWRTLWSELRFSQWFVPFISYALLLIPLTYRALKKKKRGCNQRCIGSRAFKVHLVFKEWPTLKEELKKVPQNGVLRTRTCSQFLQCGHNKKGAVPPTVLWPRLPSFWQTGS